MRIIRLSTSYYDDATALFVDGTIADAAKDKRHLMNIYDSLSG